MNWYLKVLKQYVDFSGRARRKEYWMFMLIHFIIILMIVFLMIYSIDDLDSDEAPDSIIMGVFLLYFFGTLLPSIAVTVRRLHDTGKSGWWYLINFIPYIGKFILLIFACMEGDARTNQWGANPKGRGNYRDIDLIGKE